MVKTEPKLHNETSYRAVTPRPPCPPLGSTNLGANCRGAITYSTRLIIANETGYFQGAVRTFTGFNSVIWYV